MTYKAATTIWIGDKNERSFSDEDVSVERNVDDTGQMSDIPGHGIHPPRILRGFVFSLSLALEIDMVFIGAGCELVTFST